MGIRVLFGGSDDFSDLLLVQDIAFEVYLQLLFEVCGPLDCVVSDIEVLPNEADKHRMQAKGHLCDRVPVVRFLIQQFCFVKGEERTTKQCCVRKCVLIRSLREQFVGRRPLGVL